MSAWTPAALDLVSLLPATARGPRREGLYAVWLVVRIAQDLLLDPPIPERMHRKRVAALEARLSSLTIPSTLRRGLSATLLELRDARPESAAAGLSHLVAPAREALGGEAADVVARTARAAAAARKERA
jgi:hypothetical protein